MGHNCNPQILLAFQKQGKADESDPTKVDASWLSFLVHEAHGHPLIHWKTHMFRSIIKLYMGIYIYLVGGIPDPLKNMTSSVGMMKLTTEWKMFQTSDAAPSCTNEVTKVSATTQHPATQPLISKKNMNPASNKLHTTKKVSGVSRQQIHVQI